MYYTETLALAPNHHGVHRFSMGVKRGVALRDMEIVNPACGPASDSFTLAMPIDVRAVPNYPATKQAALALCHWRGHEFDMSMFLSI